MRRADLAASRRSASGSAPRGIGAEAEQQLHAVRAAARGGGVERRRTRCTARFERSTPGVQKLRRNKLILRDSAPQRRAPRTVACINALCCSCREQLVGASSAAALRCAVQREGRASFAERTRTLRDEPLHCASIERRQHCDEPVRQRELG